MYQEIEKQREDILARLAKVQEYISCKDAMKFMDLTIPMVKGSLFPGIVNPKYFKDIECEITFDEFVMEHWSSYSSYDEYVKQCSSCGMSKEQIEQDFAYDYEIGLAKIGTDGTVYLFTY